MYTKCNIKMKLLVLVIKFSQLHSVKNDTSSNFSSNIFCFWMSVENNSVKIMTYKINLNSYINNNHLIIIFTFCYFTNLLVIFLFLFSSDILIPYSLNTNDCHRRRQCSNYTDNYTYIFYTFEKWSALVEFKVATRIIFLRIYHQW